MDWVVEARAWKLQVPFGINQKLFNIVSSQFDILTVRTEHGIEFMIFGIEASQNWTQAVFEPTTAMDCWEILDCSTNSATQLLKLSYDIILLNY